MQPPRRLDDPGPGDTPRSVEIPGRLTFWDRLANVVWRGRAVVRALEAQQTPADDELLGKIGLVTAAIEPERTGEVRLPVRGGSEDFLAIAKSALAVNEAVTVVAVYAPRTVLVEKA